MNQDQNKLTFIECILVMAFILFVMSAESIVLWFFDLIGL